MSTNSPITNVLTNYIGINGLVVQNYNEIKEDITQKYVNIFGNNINLEQNSPDGQLIGLWTQEKADILDLIVQYYNNLDPERAIGIPQQILYKLNGLTIKSYQYSYVYVNVTTTGPVTLPGLDENVNNPSGTGFTVSDTSGNDWILVNTQNITSAGTFTLNFRAAEIGAVVSLTNTITTMLTILPNVQSVNNPAVNYITGGSGESASEFSNRRSRSLSAPSQGFDESVESQLLALDNVTQVYVHDNRGDVTDQYGVGPHTLWVIVGGGNSIEIGNTIYANIPPGIPMKGEQQVIITKPNGTTTAVYYDIPMATPLYIKATLANFTNAPLDENYIKEQLSLTTYEIFEMATNSQITANLKTIVGKTAEPYDVQISNNNIDWVEYVNPSTLNEYFTISPDNITLTLVNTNVSE